MAWPFAGLCSPCTLSGPPPTQEALSGRTDPTNIALCPRQSTANTPVLQLLITGKPAKHGCALVRRSTGVLFCALTRNSAHTCDVCVRASERGEGLGGDWETE